MSESQKYAIVDLETTGHSPNDGDRMIQIAIVIMRDWHIEKTFTSFIHPGKSIPLFIQDLTNISDDDVKDALPFEAHADYIYEIIQDSVFVAHNADFDLSFLQAEFKRAGLPKWRGKKLDTVELSKILFPTSLSFKLGDLAADLNIPLDNAHRADSDAIATALLLKKCWEELLTLPLITLEQLHKKSFRLKSNISQLLFEALLVKRSTVTEEQNTVYYRKLALKKRTDNNKEQKQILYPQLHCEKMKLFQSGISNFEERPQQFVMMDQIWESLNNNQEIMIEASTGIGKTIGYLLPAVIYAKQHQTKVCISTYTSHLLEQLLSGEVPKIEKILGCSVNVALLKGMRNYADVVQFEQLMKLRDFSYDETLTILQLLVWLTKTETGDLNEINVSGGGQLFVDKIRKDPENHLPNNNQFDFYERAIAESENAEIIITNHAMLLADLERKDAIFKNINGWIIDEAHQFIQSAVSRDETIFSFTKWKYVFGQIGLSTDKHLFAEFYQAALKKHRVSMQKLDQLEKKFMRITQLFDETMQQIVNGIKSVSRYSKTHTKHTAFLNELKLDRQYIKHLSTEMQNWIDLAENCAQQFVDDVEEMESEHIVLIEQWRYWIRELKVKAFEWDEIFVREDESSTIWVELDRRNVPGSIQVFKKPIHVSEQVQKLFNWIRPNHAIIWTSGTLTLPNNIRYIADQLGIHEEVPILSLQAPPEFYSGAKTYIMSDMPDIQSVSQSDFIESVALAVTRIVQTTEGRSFVLFTSQDMLRKTVELIQESGLLEEYVLFAQGVTSGSRMRLLKSFQKFNRSVLFGTNSFWEGVDVPGESLSSVIIVRLPFSSPDEPTFKAKSISLQERGKNAFTHLSLPDAILRFKQGFGRLIRSPQDKGVFIILDRRIETKSYGKEFIQALPPISVQKLPLQNMVLELEHWYNIKDEERKQVDNNGKSKNN